MLPTGDVLDGPELDRIDDELFATEYWVPSQRRHRTVLPEPPTVRFRPTPVTVPAVASPYTEDENGTEIVVLIGLAVLLVVGVAATAIFVVWWL